MIWDIIYKKAYNQDGSLFFPERLNHDFLEHAKRSMGSYLFANQYLNEIIPVEEQVFKPEWVHYYAALPEIKTTFAFIDPAISQEDHADYTAIVVIDCDLNSNWYIRYAERHRMTPTQIVNKCFELQKEFNTQGIGIEDVAYQKALIYMLAEEVKRRQEFIPIKGIHPGTTKTKEMRILGLVPRFEWGKIFLRQGLSNLELELMQFPRSEHDDIIDALSLLEQIVYYPVKKKETLKQPHSPHDPNYEKWIHQELIKKANGQTESPFD